MTNDVKEMGEVLGELQTTDLRVRLFRSLDAALDFCKFVQPEELFIKRFTNGQCQLQYISPDNDL
ncbi:hypothetical protein vBPpSSYP_198 [Pseudomonas phage vB_PpS_SYP]|nr:hypothetical protein vBPpSSYP_198 [Pseudomonas phage vB_PpS_SYP]